ncbi:uracil-DNA glycosylase [Thiotrichales bacterium 19S9-12]|nr:uracil-DNA glycosylase [Thiotrichales bacterium 19S9-11]MCF6811713.1 uracil-DNA glycosylase [Thiotrichales bacterium 19S9-12]
MISTNLSWKDVIGEEKQKVYFKKALNHSLNERKEGKVIYPKVDDVFNAFELTEFDNLKVVILGQDPYHGPNQAHGLAFSVNKGIRKPPSLLNIFKELNQDIGMEIPENGDLSSWAKQGVFLLNTVLTVEHKKAHSHANYGWETFTDQVIKMISDHHERIVFMLWGAPAQRKKELINQSKHCILTSPHPSPLSAHRGFLGCKHFSQCNDYLKKHHIDPINWQLSI